MFKKFLFFLILNILFMQSAFAMTLEEGKQAFQAYIKNSNACNMALVNMYDKNSVIKRIVINPDGSTYVKVLPIAMYKMMLMNYSKIALWQGYNNTYTNVMFSQVNDDVVIKAIRHPSTSKEKLPATIVFRKNKNGKIMIKEEVFHTNAAFLLK